jgi:hypothetical protein
MTSFAATHHFVAYWSNNGHRLILARDGLSAFDPKQTISMRQDFYFVAAVI